MLPGGEEEKHKNDKKKKKKKKKSIRIGGGEAHRLQTCVRHSTPELTCMVLIRCSRILAACRNTHEPTRKIF